MNKSIGASTARKHTQRERMELGWGQMKKDVWISFSTCRSRLCADVYLYSNFFPLFGFPLLLGDFFFASYQHNFCRIRLLSFLFRFFYAHLAWHNAVRQSIQMLHFFVVVSMASRHFLHRSAFRSTNVDIEVFPIHVIENLHFSVLTDETTVCTDRQKPHHERYHICETNATISCQLNV